MTADLPKLKIKCQIRDYGCGLCDNCFNRSVLLAHVAAHQKEAGWNHIHHKECEAAMKAVMALADDLKIDEGETK